MRGELFVAPYAYFGPSMLRPVLGNGDFLANWNLDLKPCRFRAVGSKISGCTYDVDILRTSRAVPVAQLFTSVIKLGSKPHQNTS